MPTTAAGTTGEQHGSSGGNQEPSHVHIDAMVRLRVPFEAQAKITMWLRNLGQR